MQKKAVAFTGPSNSGKTTLILKVAAEFMSRGLRVAIIKHDPGDKASFDVAGKDSFKFSAIGADVAVLSPTRSTYFLKQPDSIQSAISRFQSFDLLLVEGLKHLPLPRIGVFKDSIDSEYLSYCDAIASYEKSAKTWLNLDDIASICEWILANAKDV